MSQREKRLEKVVEAVHRLEQRGEAPSRAQLVARIQATWEVTEQTAKDYVETLERGDRLTSNRHGTIVLTDAERVERGERGEQATLSCSVKEEVINDA